MISWLARHTRRMLVACVTLLTLASCGGGGGGGGGGFIPDRGADANNLALLLEFIDFLGNPTSTVTSTTPATLIVHVTDRNNPAEGLVVTATSDIGVIVPASGTDLTDADGMATFRIEAGTVLGAGTITVTVDGDAGTVEATQTLQVDAADLRLGNFQDGMFQWGEIGLNPDSLSANGSSQLFVAVVDANDERVDTIEMVNLLSECVINGQSTIVPANPIPTVNGQVIAIYTAGDDCADQDVITARLEGDDATRAQGTLTLAPVTANNTIAFNGADPTLISLKGTGGGTIRQERARVTFQVLDATLQPAAGVEVTFELSTSAGGLSLTSTSTVTDSDGLANAFVNSGDVATSVRVIATIQVDDGSGILAPYSTLSDLLVVSSGLPDQNSISLSTDIFTIPGGFNKDGVPATLTVRMADKFNNPVPDGTSALFTTEYGSIEDSCTTVGGACSVTWTSQEPRFPTLDPTGTGGLVRTIFDPDYSCPSHDGAFGPCPDLLGAILGGRFTILVTAIGEEFFVDRNANGTFDQDEADAEPALFQNLPEAFLDHNEDGVYTPALGAGPGPGCAPPTTEEQCEAAGFEETFSDFNSDGVYNLNVDPNTGKGVYNGILCPREGDGVWCSRELVHVRDSIVLTLSADNNFDIILVEPSNNVNRVVNGTIENRTYIAYVADIFNNPPADGSTISLTPEGNCEIISENPVTVPLTGASGAFGFDVRTDGSGGTDAFTITVNPVDGNPYSETFSCTSFAPVDPCDLSPQPPECAP